MEQAKTITSGTYRLKLSEFAHHWTYFIYRATKGILEAKMRDNSFDTWQVIDSIPEGAELV